MDERSEGSVPEPKAPKTGGPSGTHEERPERTLRPVWEVPERRWGPYLELLSVRVPDFAGPVTQVFITADEAGAVVGLVAQNAAGQRAAAPFVSPPVVASQCRLETVCQPRLH